MRYLASDFGLKRTGLAVCDGGETIASPLTVLVGQGALVERILGVIGEEGVEGIVVGLPLNMDGTEGPQSRKVRDFAAKLAEQVDLPMHFQDERLSSYHAEKALAGLEMTRKKKKKHIDSIAAAAILQAFLDDQHSGGGE